MLDPICTKKLFSEMYNFEIFLIKELQLHIVPMKLNKEDIKN